MELPRYEEFMLPLLQLAADGAERRNRDAYEAMAQAFGISDEQRQQMLPSGSQPVFNNRIVWALSYLRQAGLIASPKRGIFHITDEGRALLAEKPSYIDAKTLERYPAFLEFKHRTRKPKQERGKQPQAETTYSSATTVATGDDAGLTPVEEIEDAWHRHRLALEADLLEQVRACSPTFFERLVVDVLVAIGYGGNRSQAARSVGQSGDGGIDGTIDEDPLGLEVIYIQTKRWQGSVGRPEVQRFAGALQGQRARKGVMLTTSEFTREASDYVSTIDPRIVLIDGQRLAQLMVDHGVGVSVAGHYPMHRIDSDYFTEE